MSRWSAVVVAVAVGVALSACATDRPAAPGAASTELPPIGTDACPTPEELLPADRAGVEGKRLPDLTLDCLGHPGAVSLRALGGRPTVVNLWASWCGPCRNEMPVFQRVHQQAGDRLRVIGVNTQDYNETAARRTIQSTGIGYAVLSDPEGRLRAGVGAVGMPTTLFVDGTGRLVHTELGEMSEAQLRERIRTSLGVTL